MSTFVKLTRLDLDGKPHPLIVNIDHIQTIHPADSAYDGNAAAYLDLVGDDADTPLRPITADAYRDLLAVLPLVLPPDKEG